MKEIEETAKAAQEIAKTAGKGIDASRDLGGFFGRIVGDGFSELGLAFKDWAQYYRFSNALKLRDRVEKIIGERGLVGKTTPIELRLAIPLIQNATEENDELLLDMWSALMANAIDPNRNIEAKRPYTNLLSSFQPVDAQVLMLLFEEHELNPDHHEQVLIDGSSEARRNVSWISDRLQLSREAIVFSVEALGRLGLVYDYMSEKEEHSSAIPAPLTHTAADLALTFTALALLKACNPNLD